MDAGNGMAGHTVPVVFEGLPITLIPLYFELDGTFPNHEANPIDPENLRDLQQAVKDTSADIGLAFDGDADRCFVVDERGEIVSPSVLAALIATRELAREPGATVIHNLITSRAVPEMITEHGGTPVRTRVGPLVHQGEDGGDQRHLRRRALRPLLLQGLLVRRLGHAGRAARAGRARPRQTGRCPSCCSDFSRYAASGEINSEVADQAAATAKVKNVYAARPGVTLDELDGLTIIGDDWWFNLRPSNTEPLLRLNVEAADDGQMAAIRDEVLGLVREARTVTRRMSCSGTRRLGAGHHRLPQLPRRPAGRRRRERAGVHGLRAGLPGPRQHPGAAGGRGAAA